MKADNRKLLQQEACRRIRELTAKYDLNPNILKYFEEGKLYYSYLTAGGLIGSIDRIGYDERYEREALAFEQEHSCLVYHAVASYTEFGELLSLLYVGADEEEWEEERLSEDYIFAYNVNLTYPGLSEFGYIVVSGYGSSGALVRIG